MQLENLINQTIELEGLLRVLRDRKAPAVRALAEDKFRTLSKEFEAYFAEGASNPLEDLAKGSISYPEPPAPPTPPMPPVEVACAAASPAPEKVEEENPAIDMSPVQECEVADTEEPHDNVQFVIQTEEAPLEMADDEPAEMPSAEPQEFADVDADEEPEEMAAPSFRSEGTPAAHDLSHAFTVNDRFLFIRQLFRGDAEDFAQTVKVLSAMPDLTEAKEYLFQDLMWDPSEPAVEGFVTILSRYLPARS